MGLFTVMVNFYLSGVGYSIRFKIVCFAVGFIHGLG